MPLELTKLPMLHWMTKGANRNSDELGEAEEIEVARLQVDDQDQRGQAADMRAGWWSAASTPASSRCPARRSRPCSSGRWRTSAASCAAAALRCRSRPPPRVPGAAARSLCRPQHSARRARWDGRRGCGAAGVTWRRRRCRNLSYGQARGIDRARVQAAATEASAMVDFLVTMGGTTRTLPPKARFVPEPRLAPRRFNCARLRGQRGRWLAGAPRAPARRTPPAAD